VHDRRRRIRRPRSARAVRERRSGCRIRHRGIARRPAEPRGAARAARRVRGRRATTGCRAGSRARRRRRAGGAARACDRCRHPPPRRARRRDHPRPASARRRRASPRAARRRARTRGLLPDLPTGHRPVWRRDRFMDDTGIDQLHPRQPRPHPDTAHGMTVKTKKLALATITAGAMLALAACSGPAGGGSGDGSGDGGLIGVAMPTKSSERWIQDGNAVKAALEAEGYSVDLQYAEDDIPTQVSQIENMITKGAEALIIASIDGTTLSEVLQTAADSDIPVIAYDRLIKGTEN